MFMPTKPKPKEYSMYAPGNLVVTQKKIYSYDPNGIIEKGVTGLVLEGPTRGRSAECRVQFVGVEEPWWVKFSEIMPHLK